MSSFKNRSGEASFTLIETMVALGIIATVVLQITGVQSNAIYFGEYGRKSVQAVWMAKRVMAKVEYYWLYHKFKEMETEQTSAKFEEVDEFDELKEFTYNLTIKDWKLPIMNILTGGGLGDGGGSQQSSGSDPITAAMNKILGEDLLKVAYVEVFWPEGSQRNSESLTLLLTNQQKVDSLLAKNRSVYDKLTKPKKKRGKKKPKSKSPGARGSKGGKQSGKSPGKK